MRRIITLILILVATYNGAFAQVHAQFTASQLYGCPPLVVSFTNQSTGANTYSWDFDNNNTSSLPNPTASFPAPGIYNVLLSASNGVSTDTQTVQIRVFQPPQPAFTAPDNHGCGSPCHTVHFTNQTIPGESPVVDYVWDFGDTSSAVHGYNVTHCYDDVGSFNVTLIVIDSNGCQKSRTMPGYVVIGASPTASMSASPTQSCTSPLTVNFTGTGSSPNGAVTYAWYFGNGLTSAQQNTTTTYTTGIYQPVLVVSDPFGCQATDTGLVEVTVVQALFSVPSDSGCRGIPIQFTDQTNFAETWSWNFGDGTALSTDTNPTHAYANNGNYTVTLTATYNNCSDTYTQTAQINISTPVNFTISANPATSCSAPLNVNFSSTASGGASYEWTFGDGGTSTAQSPSHTYNAEGTYPVSLSVSNGQGCVNTVTDSNLVGIGNPHADFDVDSTDGCSPLVIHFTNNSTSVSPLTYYWDFGDATTSTAANPTHSYSGGTFNPTLIITNADGCVDSISPVFIHVGNALIPDFTGNPLVQCVNQPVQFDNQTSGFDNNTFWEWHFGDGTTSNQFSPTHAYSDTGMYDIDLVVINQGCKTTFTRPLYIEIVEPRADFSFDYDCSNPLTVTFHDNSIGADTRFWDFGDGTSTVGDTMPVHTFPAANTYEITLVVHNNLTGCTDSTKKTLPIGDLHANFGADTTTGCTPFAVHFYDSTGTASGWRWDFGDGGSSTVQNPTHTYTVPGRYTVKLIANPAGPCTDSIVKVNYITAQGIKLGAWATPGLGCKPLNVSFYDTSSSLIGTVNQWTWDFGTGDTSHSQNTTYTFYDPGNHYINLDVSDNLGCTAHKQLVVSIQDPQALFYCDSIACPGESVHFTNVSYLMNNCVWDFGDGSPPSTVLNPDHVFQSSGSYTVTLVIYTYGAACPDTFVLPNAVQVDTPIADFYPSSTFAPCPPFPVQFFNVTNRPELQWLWYFGDGQTSTAYEPLHVYFYPGDYDVALVAYDSLGCRDSIMYVDLIRVRGPVGHFQALPDSGCVPLTVTIAGTTESTVSSILDLGDGLVVNDTLTYTHTYTEVGIYFPVFTLQDSLGCTVAYPFDTVVVGLIPYPDLPADTTVCKGNYVGLNLPYGDHFQWSSSPQPSYLNCDTCKNVICAALDTVTLFVTATTNIGCVARDTIKVNVDKLPPIFPGIEFSICHNDTLQLHAGDNVTAATWSPNLYISDSNSVNPKVYPPDSMVYRVTGGNSTGCTISRIVKVYVIDSVLADINVMDTLLCQDGMVQLNISVNSASVNDTTFMWTPSQYLSSNNIPNPVAAPPPGDFNYMVVVTSSTCVPDTERVHIVISPNPTVQAGDDQTVTPGTTIQLYASSPDNVGYHWTPVDPMTCVDCRRPFLTATQSQVAYVTVTNPYGCSSFDSVIIKVVDCNPEMVYVPNTFTPNGDGVNDLLYVRGVGLRQLEFFRVFDRWGRMVYESKNINDGWDGTMPDGKKADEATYVYVASGLCSSGNTLQKQGNVTLVR